MQYQYTAVNSQKQKRRGKITADDKAQALSLLQERGLLPLYLEALSEEAAGEESIWNKQLGASDIHRAKLSKKQLMTMMHQMGIMIKAGVSLSAAMNVLIDSEKDKRAKQILLEMKDDLFTGTALSASMSKFRAFPEIMIHILQSGEANGRLDIAFERCANILQKELELTSKIRGAMGYPIFLLALTLVLVVLMNALVLPNFQMIFQQFGADLPALTHSIMHFSDFLSHNWYWVLLCLAGFAVGFYEARKYSPAFSLAVDYLLLKIPLIGMLLKKSYIARFCKTMASLLESGVEVVKAIEISTNVTPNRYMILQLKKVAEEVRLGSAISTSMNKLPLFDSLLISMVEVGEESGMLFETMEKMAELYEAQTDDAAKRMTTMLEPAMTILIAVLVGTVIISIVLPMFSMYSVISGG